eukprot:TRINITY_DN3898_c0_g1_i4.p1 TRINITY_DN3898_c0_g1~~TRINITY_DN3898_c0_g1_i4.p1  ORF type:complete len:735 (-),score=218.17 TRINITY_DN3898_c0_g1_i4:1401-3605(-)
MRIGRWNVGQIFNRSNARISETTPMLSNNSNNNKNENENGNRIEGGIMDNTAFKHNSDGNSSGSNSGGGGGYSSNHNNNNGNEEEEEEWMEPTEEIGSIPKSSGMRKRMIESTGKILEGLNEKISLKERTFYYIPFLTWIQSYSPSLLKSDLLAGISVAVMLIPQSLAFANLIGIDPRIGLQTAFFPLLIYLIFGNSKQAAIGPESVVSILSATTLDLIVGVVSDHSNSIAEKEIYLRERAAWVCVLTLMIGFSALLLGLLRFGFLVHMFSRALLSGFINAVAIHIILEQLGTLFGFSIHSHSFEIVIELFRRIKETNTIALGVGIGCLSFLVLFRVLGSLKVKQLGFIKFVPHILICVLIATIVCGTTDLKEKIDVLGKVPSGFLTPLETLKGSNIKMKKIAEVIPSAFFITVIGMIESVLVATTFASKLNYRVSNNRELVAMGLSNCIAPIFGSFPAFASLGRSALNFQSGARSQISSLVSAIIVFFSIMFLLPFFEYMPKVALAAVIINAAIGIFEFHELIFLWNIRAYQDLFLFFLSFISTNVLGVEGGIALTIAVSLLLIVKHTSSPHVAIIQRSPSNPEHFEEAAIIRDINLFQEKHDFYLEYMAERGVLIARIDEPLYFANIGQIKELFMKLEQRGTVPVHAVVLDAGNIPFVDPSAAATLHELFQEWKNRMILICLVKTRPPVVNLFIQCGIIDLVTPERMFSEIKDAIHYLEQSITDHVNQRGFP